MQEQNLPTPIAPEGSRPATVESTPNLVNNEQLPNVLPKPEVRLAPGESVNQNTHAPQFPQASLPQPITQQPAEPQSGLTKDSSLPAVADDVDLIEKVWVEKAKTIVKRTKDDPYQQEKKVSSLQEDYQKKRYGKDKTNG